MYLKTLEENFERSPNFTCDYWWGRRERERVRKWLRAKRQERKVKHTKNTWNDGKGFGLVSQSKKGEKERGERDREPKEKKKGEFQKYKFFFLFSNY